MRTNDAVGERPALDLRTADFDFDLPQELIAQHPVSPRDAARMLEIGAHLRDLGVRDLPRVLRRGDVLVINDTRVIPARLDGRRGDARVEVTLHKRLGETEWLVFAKPARRLRPGDTVEFAGGLTACVMEKRPEGDVRLGFPPDVDLFGALRAVGRVPLPPYIHRPDGDEQAERADYQTVYAASDGAVAAPTAGLHFTEELMAALRGEGVTFITVTLHVGAGTFLPVKAEHVRDHKMHAEWGTVSPGAAETINRARQAGGRIVCVGTTSLRLLESAADVAGAVHPFAGETDIFITPGYRFRTADLLLTNFHLPRSTLFMLVCAFAGMERMKAAYAHAIRQRYRFFSYGDCCLLHREGRIADG